MQTPVGARAERDALADLIDLEVVLGADDVAAADRAGVDGGRVLVAGTPVETAAVREDVAASSGEDPALWPDRLATDAGLRRALVRALIGRARATGAPLPGRRTAAAYRIIGLVLGLVGLVLGAAAARVALHYSGDEPINVWGFLGGFVLLQVALFVAMIVALVRGLRPGTAWIGGAQRVVRVLARMRWVDRLGRARADDVRATLGKMDATGDRVGTRRVLYLDAERWLLVALTQRFGLLFNVGAAATFLALVLFTDLVFSWSTTAAELHASHLVALVDALALPWSWLLPGTVPTAEAIEATRWSRLDGAFLAGDAVMAARHAASWWSFLFTALVVWGLLPRLVGLIFASWRSRRALRAVAFDDALTMRLLERLAPHDRTRWSHPSPDDVVGELLPESALPGAARGAPGGPPFLVVVWGGWPVADDDVAARVDARFGRRPAAVVLAGGLSEEPERLVLERLRRDPLPLLLLVEAREPPDKRVLRFVGDARRALRARAPIVVSPTDWPPGGAPRAPAAADRDLWRDALATLHDPHIALEAIHDG